MPLNIYIAIPVVFWILVHFRHRQIRSNHASNNSLLPLANTQTRSTQSLINLGRLIRADLSSFFVLRLSTTILVHAHSHFMGDLKQWSSSENYRSRNDSGNRKKWNLIKIIQSFYDVGSVIVVMGQILGFGGLCWCLLHLFYQYKNNRPHPTEVSTFTSWKRSMPPAVSSSDGAFPKLLIPGITIPLSHTFPIFLSMIVCTTIHELGHALVAALDGIPLLSWGYSLIIVIPTAFVELAWLPDSSKDHNPLSRLRISAAGAFHNVLTLAVLYLASYVSIGRVFVKILGYIEVSEGAVVVDASEGSSLRPFLLSGTVVTKLDDTPLVKTPNTSVKNIWDDFLLMDITTVDAQNRLDPHLGWCVERSWIDSHPTTCCLHNSTLSSASNSTTSTFCFIPQSNSGRGHCIDPVPLFDNHTIQRCASDATCNAKTMSPNICIRPHPSTSLLRISIKRNPNTEEGKVVVWSGPRREIWEQVTISTYLPGFPLFPVGLPVAGTLLFEYLVTVSISLFFFNILPIRRLDGGEILHSLLDMFVIRKTGEESILGDVDLEQGGGSSSWSGVVVRNAAWRWRAGRIESWVERTTIVLVSAILLGGAIVSGIG